MLNRRTLRIKVMQTLFAYHQSREANYALALDHIAEVFSPDLNSMEVQDKEGLKADRQAASQLFRENVDADFSPTDEKVQQIADDAIRRYHRQNDKDKKHFKKTMVVEAEKILDRYVLILMLFSEFAELASADTKKDHSRFVKNLLIKSLSENNSLETISLRRNLDWTKESDEVRSWFRELIKADETYNEYIRGNNGDDRSILLYIAKDIIFKHDVIEKYMEEKDLNWTENRAIVKSLVTKTIKSIPETEGEKFELQELSYNWEDDKTFFQNLFDETIEVENEYESLIAEKTKNWDIERIAVTDKIIMEMALAEMINFPSIPVKVTINEYIEVAKRYSTPKSKIFINGILDVIAGELREKGVIRKSGRGLIDNK